MRPTERLRLLEQIGTELQQRYTFQDIDVFLEAVGIDTSDKPYETSKRVYVKGLLSRAAEETLFEIATELQLVHSSTMVSPEPPRNWTDTKQFRLFISHISKDKAIAKRLKQALVSHGISGFVAHEDIHPTLLWQDEIERALQTMDAMVAVHTEGFSKSIWTQQEIGFALGRGVKIISFKMGEDPTGFIGKHQALPRLGRTADDIAAELSKLLAADARTKARLDEAQRELENDIPF